jgi:catecholate siderophore receptor
MKSEFQDFSLRLPGDFTPAESAAFSPEPSAAPGALTLRADPTALFSRTSVATVMLASLFATDSEAQTPAPKPAPKAKPSAAAPATSPTTTMDELVVRGQQDSPYVARTLSSPLYTEPLVDVPQTVTVVPQAVIKEQNATSLRDVLRNVPGISMQAGEGGGGPGGDFLSIRGFNARNDVFIDNVRDFGGYSRDPFNFEQVEVSKGPAGTYTGRGSTGGSVNLVSKAPKLEDSFYHSDLGIGTEDYLRFTVDVNQRLTGLWKNQAEHSASTVDMSKDGKSVDIPTEAQDPYVRASFRLNAMWMQSDVANRDAVSNERWGVAPSLAVGFGENAVMTLSYFHMSQDNLPDYGIPWVPVAQNVLPSKYWNKPSPVNYSNFYGLINRDYEEINTDIGTLNYTQSVGDWFKLNNTIRYGQTNRNSVTTAPRYNRSTDPSVAINRQFQGRDQTDTIMAEQFDVRFSFTTFGVKHDLVTGFDLSSETADNDLRAELPPASLASLYHPNPGASYNTTYEYTGAENSSTSRDVGIYLFDTLKFWNDHIELSGGVRWDYYDAELEQTDVNGVTTELGRIDRVWSWRVALAYKPVKNGSIYFAYGTSFNPSAEGAVSLAPLTSATAVLEPEENRSYEIGTKWDLFKERLSLTAALFRTDKTNARTPGLTPNDPPTVLDGEQRVQGFEIGVAGNITEHWKVFGGYAYLNSEVLKSNTLTVIPGTTQTKSQVGNELPQTPEHSFSMWTTYELPWQIEVGAGVNYIGSRYSSTDNLREAPDYWTFDAMISKQFTKNVKAQINIYNLADEEYIDRVGGGHFVPGAGRSAVLTVGVAF